MLTKICAGTYSDDWRCQRRLQKLAAEGIKTFEYFYSQNWRKDFLFLLPKIVFDFLATHQCWDEMCKEPSTTGSEMETTLAGSWLFSGSNWFYYYFIIKGSGLVNLLCLSHLFWQIQMQKNMQKKCQFNFWSGSKFNVADNSSSLNFKHMDRWWLCQFLNLFQLQLQADGQMVVFFIFVFFQAQPQAGGLVPFPYLRESLDLPPHLTYHQSVFASFKSWKWEQILLIILWIKVHLISHFW